MSPFKKNIKSDTDQESVRVAILEQKLTDFVDVVGKLDAAIEKLSEVNGNISKMLAVHDEKLAQSAKDDYIIMKSIEEIKEQNNIDHNKVLDRIEKIEYKIQDFGKFRWMTIGIGVAIMVGINGLTTLASGIIRMENENSSQSSYVKQISQI